MQRGWFSNEPRDGDTYQPGELITVSTNWERPVTVDASNPPYVNIFMNSASPAPGRSPDRADYNPELTAEHWEPTVLVFSYTVQPGDADDNGIQVGGSSLQNAGGITDYNGNAADGSWSSWERGHDVGDTGAQHHRRGLHQPSAAGRAVPARGAHRDYADRQRTPTRG